jgi:hypothetical protein
MQPLSIVPGVHPGNTPVAGMVYYYIDTFFYI